MLLLITLIPTYFLFHVDIFVKGEVVNNNSEAFRTKYGYSKKEWHKKWSSMKYNFKIL